MGNCFCLVFLWLSVSIIFPAVEHAEVGSSEMAANPSNPVLSLAPYTLDDKYKGCTKVMKNNLKSLLETELAITPKYKETWKASLRTWRKRKDSHSLPRNVTEFAEMAIMAYTYGNPSIYEEFNTATRTAGKAPREYAAYPFKSLHFLLTWGAKAFQSTKPKCTRVYRGTEVKFFTTKIFRFGQFTSTSERRTIAEFFGTITFFNVFTCEGYSISEMSRIKFEDEVLIPPYELFQVTSVKDTKNGKIVNAKSVGSCSNHNCAFVGKGWNGTMACPEHQGM
ncbi:erythroblast NAD(P)(+)--arginine ADP-ribosyltransferase-like [Sphaerodactylus townsendi]|uniref:Uncharacterized protein n=1 Tax=Sphaerodactylus townsendi TaxID=933632 RepID=A0ACB8EWX2_9SAUR|nr:erythroblast NAD(P)(+)--arginine ADP-ribosyltransferase-like [Sphaerodactylus townsendi]